MSQQKIKNQNPLNRSKEFLKLSEGLHRIRVTGGMEGREKIIKMKLLIDRFINDPHTTIEEIELVQKTLQGVFSDYMKTKLAKQ